MSAQAAHIVTSSGIPCFAPSSFPSSVQLVHAAPLQSPMQIAHSLAPGSSRHAPQRTAPQMFRASSDAHCCLRGSHEAQTRSSQESQWILEAEAVAPQVLQGASVILWVEFVVFAPS